MSGYVALRLPLPWVVVTWLVTGFSTVVRTQSYGTASELVSARGSSADAASPQWIRKARGPDEIEESWLKFVCPNRPPSGHERVRQPTSSGSARLPSSWCTTSAVGCHWWSAT
jgi:hypothetical protein